MASTSNSDDSNFTPINEENSPIDEETSDRTTPNTNENVTETSHVDRLVKDRSVYDKSIEERLITDLNFQRPQHWDDPTWKYAAYAPEEQHGTKTMPVRCLLCGFLSKGGIYRVKLHITRISPTNSKLNVKPCPTATMQIREEISAFLLKKTTKKPTPFVDVERLPTDKIKRKMFLSGVGSTSSGSKEITSCGKTIVVGPLGLKGDETLHDVVRKRRTDPKQQTTITDHMKKQERQLLDQYAGRFFITSGVAFNITLNAELQVILLFQIIKSDFFKSDFFKSDFLGFG